MRRLHGHAEAICYGSVWSPVSLREVQRQSYKLPDMSQHRRQNVACVRMKREPGQVRT